MNSNERSLQRASLYIRPHFLKFLEITQRREKRLKTGQRNKTVLLLVVSLGYKLTNKCKRRGF